MRPRDEPKPVTIALMQYVDRSYVRSIAGTKWPEMWLPSGLHVAKVEGKLWLCVTQADPVQPELWTAWLEQVERPA